MEIIEMLCYCNCDDFEELSQWKNVMKNRRSFESHLDALVKQIIEEEHYRGVVCEKLQQNLKKAVLQITHLNQMLKIALSELNVDITDALETLTHDKLKGEVVVLKAENEKFKMKLQNLKQEKLQASQDQKPLLSACFQTIDDNNLLINGKLYCLKEAYYQQFVEGLMVKENLISNLQNQLTRCKTELQNSKNENGRLQGTLLRLEGERFRASGNGSENYNLKITNLQQLLLQQRQHSDQMQQKLEVLKETLYDRDMKLEKLNDKSQDFLQKHSLLEADFSKAQEDAKRMEKSIEQLKLDLLKIKEERDICLRQNDFLQQKLLNKDLSRVQTRLSDDDQAAGDASVNVAEKSEEYSSEIRGSLNEIEKMRKVIQEVHSEIEKFSGTQEDKNFLHLREILIQNVLKLDNIHTGGIIEVRKARKTVIAQAYALLDILTEKSKNA